MGRPRLGQAEVAEDTIRMTNLRVQGDSSAVRVGKLLGYADARREYGCDERVVESTHNGSVGACIINERCWGVWSIDNTKDTQQMRSTGVQQCLYSPDSFDARHCDDLGHETRSSSVSPAVAEGRSNACA